MKEFEEFNLTPRAYQEAIFATAKEKNTLVILPTGTGKTLIALMLAIHEFKKEPLKKIVMLAPTRPLIEQHVKSFSEKLPDGWADMQLFTGKTAAEKRKEIWQSAEIIFSTPQCIANDLEKKLYDLKDVSLLIVDEAHRCLKNYAYNKVAKSYRGEEGKILALTASPGSDKTTISQICENLQIEAVEIRTRDSADVKPYLQDLEFEKIFVEYPEDFIVIKTLLEELYNVKAQELRNRGILHSYANKITLLKLQARLMGELHRSKDVNKMQGVSLTAQALKIAHAIELIETQTVNSTLEYMRDLFKQAAEKKSRGVQILTKDDKFTKAYTMLTQLNREHPKVEKLSEVVREQFTKDSNSKIIIFAQFRETVRIIQKTLNELSGVNAQIFVGQAQKQNSKGETTGLKQKEQKEMIEKFKEGEINVLVATSIAEEGLDIPEVSMVMFYEPIPSAIRKIQRAGRTARLAKGKLKILITKDTRDEIYHYASNAKEKRMYKAIDSIKKDFASGKPRQTQKTLF